MTEPVASPPSVAAEPAPWRRLHPLTPVIRSWRVLAIALAVGGQNGFEHVSRGDGFSLSLRFVGVALGVLAAIVLVGAVWSVLSWRMTRFRVGPESLELHSGVLSRRQRSARLDRLQAVDVVQPFLARIVGLSRLTLEVAGGQGSDLSLSYLSEAEARELRNHLLARAAGVDYATPHAPEAPERPVVELPAGRLLGSLVLSPPALVAVAGVSGLVVVAAFSGKVGLALGSVPAVFAIPALLWQRFSGSFGFTVASSPDGLRLRHGLLEHRAQTVPPGRVQAVQVAQPLLWRKAGWWRLELNVAGYGGGRPDGERSTESMLLPVGTRAEALQLLALVLPDLGVAELDPRAVVDEGLTGLTRSQAAVGAGPGQPAGAGWLTAPRRARWVDPVGWRRTGVLVTGEALLIRHGRLHRRLTLVPHARTQSLGLSQGPLQRRMRVTSFVLHSTPGPVRPVVQHLDSAAAGLLLQAQSERARQARSQAGPECWMQPGSEPAGS